MTLIELMVAVVIVGVLLTVAVVMIGGDGGVDRASQMLANRVREASRMAISRGIVDASIANDCTGGAACSGSDPSSPSARTRLQIRYDSGADVQVINLDIRDEQEAAGAEWRVVSETALPRGATIEGFAPSLVVSQGTGPTITQLKGPHSPGAGQNTLELYFYPDGSVTDDQDRSITFFLHSLGEQRDERRVAVLPLQGRPVVMRGY
jgi:prepilin-type N-terminal cleavage/methylation domain-containing protein